MWLSIPIASAASLRARAGMSLSFRVLDQCGASSTAAVLPELFFCVTLISFLSQYDSQITLCCPRGPVPNSQILPNDIGIGVDSQSRPLRHGDPTIYRREHAALELRFEIGLDPGDD